MSADDFNPVNPLEHALVKAATDPSARPAFYRLLLESDVYFLIPDTTGEQTVEDGAPLSLANWTSKRGDFIPFFSSLERANSESKNESISYGHIVITGQTGFEMLAQNTIPGILNPGFSYGKEFLVDEIKGLADGSFFDAKPETVGAGRQIMLGQPAEYPTKLVETLKIFFQRQPSVIAAYFAQIHDPASGQPPHLIIGIECPGSMHVVAPDAVIAVREISASSEPIDFVEVGGDKGSLDEYFKQSTEPFYQRAAK